MEADTSPEIPKLKQAVKAIIWRRTGLGEVEFLLLKLNEAEAAEKPGGVEWHPAGGAKEAGESDHDAILREISEETGIEPAEVALDGEPFLTREWDAPYDGVPGFHFEASFYGCEYLGEDREFQRSREHDDIGWFTLDDLPAGLPPQGQEAIERFMASTSASE